MSLGYDNDKLVHSLCDGFETPRDHFYSMIEAQIAALPSGIGTDWTIEGVKALSIRFRGTGGNGIEPMWVKLTDTSDNFATVTYGTYADEDVEDINEASWHEWNIDIADFGGVNVASLKSMQMEAVSPN